MCKGEGLQATCSLKARHVPDMQGVNLEGKQALPHLEEVRAELVARKLAAQLAR